MVLERRISPHVKEASPKLLDPAAQIVDEVLRKSKWVPEDFRTRDRNLFLFSQNTSRLYRVINSSSGTITIDGYRLSNALPIEKLRGISLPNNPAAISLESIQDLKGIPPKELRKLLDEIQSGIEVGEGSYLTAERAYSKIVNK